MYLCISENLAGMGHRATPCYADQLILYKHLTGHRQLLQTLSSSFREILCLQLTRSRIWQISEIWSLKKELTIKIVYAYMCMFGRLLKEVHFNTSLFSMMVRRVNTENCKMWMWSMALFQNLKTYPRLISLNQQQQLQSKPSWLSQPKVQCCLAESEMKIYSVENHISTIYIGILESIYRNIGIYIGI